MADDPLRRLHQICLASPETTGVYLDMPVDWSKIEDLVADAYRGVAGKR